MTQARKQYITQRGVVVLASLLAVHVESAQQSLPPDLSAFAERLHMYCNNPASLSGSEGSLPVPGAHLRHAHVIFRHGDRSAIHTLPNTSRIAFPCERPSQDHVRWAASMLSPLHAPPVALSRGACAPSFAPMDALPRRVADAITAWNVSRVDGSACGPTGGELSTFGWEQLEAIGAALAHRYSDLLLRDTPHTTAVRVATTDTGRTALSVTAFLRGFIIAATANTSISVPQLTLPLPLHVMSRAEDPVMFAQQMLVCPVAAEYERQHHRTVHAHARLPMQLLKEIAHVAGLHVDRLPLSELVVDDIFTRLCHGAPLPCWTRAAPMPQQMHVAATPARDAGMATPEAGVASVESRAHRVREARAVVFKSAASDVCMNVTHAQRAVHGGDEYYRTRYASASTRLLMLPFLQDVASIMRDVLAGACDAPRIIMRAAHDTVLAPVLATLGVPVGSEDRPHAWPGYANRIAFELWDLPLATEAHIRVLYQGVDVTRHIACARALESETGDSVHVCPLSSWTALLDELTTTPLDVDVTAWHAWLHNQTESVYRVPTPRAGVSAQWLHACAVPDVAAV